MHVWRKIDVMLRTRYSGPVMADEIFPMDSRRSVGGWEALVW